MNSLLVYNCEYFVEVAKKQMPFVIVSALVQLSWKRDYRLTMSIFVTGKKKICFQLAMLSDIFMVGPFSFKAIKCEQMQCMLGQLSGSTTAVLPLSSFVSCPDCFSMAILLMLFCTAAFAIIKKNFTESQQKITKICNTGKSRGTIARWWGKLYCSKFYFTTTISVTSSLHQQQENSCPCFY